jgi:hypothetical protein
MALQKTLAVQGDLADAIEYFIDKGWTDGLPIVPPTAELVERMLRHSTRAPEDVLGVLPPSRAEATVHAVAVNAVMAGCRPEYLPVVESAIEAIADPAFSLFGIQATTNPVTPLLVINGPIGTTLGVNSKSNCLGNGTRSNATIGRALRLCMQNIGGGLPGLMDMATQGQPGKYTMCIAENEEESPWEPFHVEHGFDREVSTVTAISVTGTFQIHDGYSKDALDLLQTFSSSCVPVGSTNMHIGGGPLLIVGPEHAEILHSAGFSKSDMKGYLYETARAPVRAYSQAMLRYSVHNMRRPRRFASTNPESTIPLADSAEDISIVVAGGPGGHSVFLPSMGAHTRPVTRVVKIPSLQ